jgi:hypothetical protein
LISPTDVTGEYCYSISGIVSVGYTTITIAAFAQVRIAVNQVKGERVYNSMFKTVKNGSKWVPITVSFIDGYSVQRRTSPTLSTIFKL